MNFNFLDFINVPFAYVMRFFDSFTGSYALSLLLFAILIKLIFIPVGIKQQKNQIKQASLRPKEEILRKKYAGRTDKATQQKMQQEMSELYQKENFSPMSGCLPLIIQLVVIMVLYNIIRQPLTYICGFTSESLLSLAQQLNLALPGGKDLVLENIGTLDQITASASITTQLDTLIGSFPELAKLPNFNFLGLNLALTPKSIWDGFIGGTEVASIGIPKIFNVIAYAIIPAVCFVLQFLTMKLTRKFTYQSQATEQANSTMKVMDFAMPLMSLFFCFGFSSAIGLYWIYQNVLSFAQTVILAKAMPVPKFTDEDIKKAEKEMKAKGFDSKKADLPRVRSLHHIDDEDYDELPTAKSTSSKGSNQPLLNGEKVTLKDEKDKKNR